MSILIILLVTVTAAIIGRYLFNSWLNHVSFYSVLWCFNLVLFELRFIKYYPLEDVTWLVIFAAWGLFVAGSVTALQVMRFSSKESAARSAADTVGRVEIDMVRRVLWIINIVTLAAALYNLYVASRIYGGISNAFIIGNLIYSYRVSEGIPGTIPYVATFSFIGSVLAGLYTAWKQRITIVATLPIIVIIIIDFTLMGRADILVSAILFIAPYLAAVAAHRIPRRRRTVNVRKYISFALVLVIVVAGAELIRSTRKMKENFKGSTASLNKLSASSIITPSIYLYFSASIGVLNQYLRQDREDTPVGAHTFLTLYRIGERAGLDLHASTYQQWYRTPQYSNTGTYLRELHGDYGIIGLCAGPYLLGFASSVFWVRYQRRRRYVDLFLLAFLFANIGLSFIVIATRMGGFFFFPFVAVMVGMVLDRRFRKPVPGSGVQEGQG